MKQLKQHINDKLNAGVQQQSHISYIVSDSVHLQFITERLAVHRVLKTDKFLLYLRNLVVIELIQSQVYNGKVTYL